MVVADTIFQLYLAIQIILLVLSNQLTDDHWLRQLLCQTIVSWLLPG